MQTAHTGVVDRQTSPASWINVAAGVALFIAPWVLGYTDEALAFVSSLVVGAVAVVAALLAVGVHRGFEWANLVGAGYAIIASLVGDYSGAAIGSSLVLGGIIALVAIGTIVSRPRDF